MRSVRPSRALVWLAAGVLVVSLVPNLLNLKVEATNIRNRLRPNGRNSARSSRSEMRSRPRRSRI